MSSKKGRDGVMAIKINLEKAYDWLEWDFIRDTLNLFKFPEHLSSIILSCISFATVSVLYNGGALEPFHPSRGIRQEDPLSPYLFILCMEVLGALITDKCQTNLWNAIPASKGGISFSHLFFVDDLVLFAKVDYKNCIVVRDALDTFCDLFGQKVSDEKSRVFFSPNISQHTRKELCSILKFQSTPSLGKYLDFLIKHKSITQDFGAVIEQVQNRLAGWKAYLLSFASILVLTQATISTIPNHVMQCNSLPPKITQNIDKLCLNFLWSLTEEKKKLHLISWKKITKPKNEGGLGLQADREKNVEFLAKLN